MERIRGRTSSIEYVMIELSSPRLIVLLLGVV